MKISKEVKTGIVVVIAIALFVYGFNFMKGKNVFSSRDIYYSVYSNASGIVESNPVQINGFKVGRVKKVDLLDATGQIIVTMAISDGEVRIPKGTVAKIVSPEFLGGKAIELILGNSDESAQDGDTLTSQIDPSLQESVNSTIKPLKDKAEKLIGSIDSIMLVVQAVLDKNTRENLAKSFDNIKHALETFDRAALRLDTMILQEKYKISSIFSKVDLIATNLANNNDKISNALQNFSAISDTLAKANLAKTIENANNALSGVASIMEKINKGEGTAGLLIKDEKLYRNLTAASASVDSLVKDMEVNPWRYISIRGKRHRTK
jgi:phospholipid/cholesterol/gamma-HCH transport system substrate-binding protein